MTNLEVKGLRVSVGEKEIVKGLDLNVNSGEIHAIMGPNGGGKSTLAFAVMGHPRYIIGSGDILLDGKSILGMQVDERARNGLFLSFQYPSEINGVRYTNFLKAAINAGRKVRNEQPVKILEFNNMLKEQIEKLNVDNSFINRSLNEGFSGGEKKRSEILQMAMLRPRIAILDEPDSGLDIDALKIVAENVKKMANEGIGIIVITHYQRILEYLHPDHVHVFVDGMIVKSGDKELAKEIEEKGYGQYVPEVVMQ